MYIIAEACDLIRCWYCQYITSNYRKNTVCHITTTSEQFIQVRQKIHVWYHIPGFFICVLYSLPELCCITHTAITATYLFIPLGKFVTGLYILLALISSFFLYFFTMSKAISVSTWLIFTIFSLREFSWLGPVFPIPQGTLPWQPILCHKQNTNLVRFLQFLYCMKAFWV